MGRCKKCRIETCNRYLFKDDGYCKECLLVVIVNTSCCSVLDKMPAYDYELRSSLLWEVGLKLMEMSKEVIEIHHGKEM